LSSGDEGPAVGLRERKKARTRASIQAEAMRLFRARGYQATTVEQIADAAEVSPSTFFRYFPTKEDVVLWDEFDPLLVEAVRRRPPSESPVTAMRAAFTSVFAELSDEERERVRERTALIMAEPDLRAATLEQFTGTVELLAGIVAERAGKPASDMSVLALAGAVVGVTMSVMIAAGQDPNADFVALLDAAMALLEEGLPV